MDGETLKAILSLIQKGYVIPIVCPEKLLIWYVNEIEKAGLKITNKIIVDDLVIIYVAKGVENE